jgi:hypothetical protein
MCVYDGLCLQFWYLSLDSRAASKYFQLVSLYFVYLSHTQVCMIFAVDQSERIVGVVFSFSLCAQTSYFAELQLPNRSII